MNKDNTLYNQLLPVYWFTLLCMIFKKQINRLKTGKTLHTVFNASNYAYAANTLHMIFAHIQEFVTSHILHHGMNLNSRVILCMLNLSNLFVWIVMWGAFQWKRYFHWLFALGELGTFILPSFTEVYSATCLVHVMEKRKRVNIIFYKYLCEPNQFHQLHRKWFKVSHLEKCIFGFGLF